MIRTIVTALLTATIAFSGAAQQPATQEPGSQLTVYLLTMGPGDQVWEKFGHNAIWIHDEANHTDIAYHWGLFDFADRNFLPNFIKGRMRYAMGAFDLGETLNQYRQTNRTVWSQKLNMTAEQKLELQQFVSWNVLPENRYYRYDYYRDNCSTRVRDAIDRSIGKMILRHTAGVSSHSTYRFHTSRLTQDDWPVFTGTMAALGEPVDRDISVFEEMFLPVRMKARLASLRIPVGETTQPFVLEERVLVQSTRPPEATGVNRGILTYLLISVVILAAAYGLWVFGGRGRRDAVLLSLAAIWSLVAGIGGIVLAFLWIFTDHLYSYRNENLFQLNPLSLILAFMLILTAVRICKTKTPSAATIRWARIIAGLAVLGFVVQLLPFMNQVNGDVIALALPLHIGVLALLGAMETRSDPATQAA